MSFLMFSELSCCYNTQAAANTGPSPFGGPSSSVGVSGQSSSSAAQFARLSADGELYRDNVLSSAFRKRRLRTRRQTFFRCRLRSTEGRLTRIPGISRTPRSLQLL